MPALINGSGDASKLEGWVILWHGGTWIGKRVGSARPTLLLRPVYVFNMIVQPVQQGIQRTPHVAPPDWLSEVRELEFPEWAPHVKVSDLSKTEQRIIAAAVTRCDDTLRAMRASDAGVVLATGKS